MRKIIFSILSLLTVLLPMGAQSFRNPVLNADAPDMSICKVQDTYYMISTTMHLMPGGPIMSSKDMINWKTIGYVFDRIDDGDRYNLIDGKTVYGQGQWASSIRYHMGKFYVWFTANGAPGRGFIFSAEKPEGPWKLVARPPHMHDASLFFDEDGKAYMFTGSGNCRVVELRDDLSDVKAGGLDKVVVTSANDPEERGALLEGSSVFKHNGYYYICMISMKWGVKGRVRREVCYRSRTIDGPYEKKVILEIPFETYGGVGQGCLVGDDQSDLNWWTLMFQDRGGIGRIPCLLPVNWVEGWPMCGVYDGTPDTSLNESPNDNPTNNPRLDKRRYRVPSDLSKAHPSLLGIIGSDEFNILPTDDNGGYHKRKGLNLYWQWNHNPIDEAWSLTERPGFMRLRTCRVVNSLQLAPNTLTQRMGGPVSTGEACLDIRNMKDGDVCGLAAFNGDSPMLRIVKKGKRCTLQLVEEKSFFKEPRDIDHVDVNVIAEKQIPAKSVWLRLHADFTDGRDMCSFAYSLNGNVWNAIGNEMKMVFDYRRHFMGSKFALFNYATVKTGGYVDVDWFHYYEK